MAKKNREKQQMKKMSINQMVGFLESDHKYYKHKPIKVIDTKEALTKIIPTLKRFKVYGDFKKKSNRFKNISKKFKIASTLLQDEMIMTGLSGDTIIKDNHGIKHR